MNLDPIKGNSRRLKRLAFRVALIAGIGCPLVVLSQEIKIELRPRTDANVQSDIRAALALQKKILESKPSSGLSDLTKPDRPSLSSPPSVSQVAPASSPQIVVLGDSVPCPPIIIGSCVEPAVAYESGAAIRGSVQVSPKVEKRLAPPTMSRIKEWQPEQRFVSRIDDSLSSASRQWKPVRAQLVSIDAEAVIRPQLNNSITIGDSSLSTGSSVIAANFQAPADGFSQPGLPYQGQPSGAGIASPPIMPNQPPTTVMPGPPMVYPVPRTNVAPGMGQTILPNNATSGTSYVNGEPFVTAPPCQFDAYNMLEPSNFQTGACGPVAGPCYSGIPGNTAPSTIMPNQAPGLYSPNNSGFRPLLGFGQDRYNVQLGRGIIGQPVAYVPGQPFRNFLRYIFP